MIFDPPLAEARLVRRYKRFLADVVTPMGDELTLHCPNTGSMRNCLREDGLIYYSTSTSAKRRYPHTWELSTDADGHCIGINTLRANALVGEALLANRVPGFENVTGIRREVAVGEGSRLDFAFNLAGREWLCEVKNVTLHEGAGRGYFPDCVSARGLKHLRVLTDLAAAGRPTVLIFCVQHSAIETVAGAVHLDPAYAAALALAAARGVRLVALGASLSPARIVLDRTLPVLV